MQPANIIATEPAPAVREAIRRKLDIASCRDLVRLAMRARLGN